MAPHADSLRARAELGICRMVNSMIVVTHHAAGKVVRLECASMRAFQEHLMLESVACRTDVLHHVHAWGRSAMVPVASRAGWRSQVPADDQCVVVHAGVV